MTPQQLAVLNGRFAINQYLKEHEASELSELLGLTVKQVHNWYGKRRYTMKQKAAAGNKTEYAHTPSGTSSNMNDFETASNGSNSGPLRPWKRLTSAQIAGLTAAFQQNPYLQPEDTEYLADRLDLSVDKIRGWYANKRKSMRKFDDAESVGSDDSNSPSSTSLKSHHTMNYSQSDALNSAFASSQYLETLQADELSAELGISADKVRNWYSNKRASQRKTALDSPTLSTLDLYTPLSNSPDSTIAETLSSSIPAVIRPSVRSNTILSADQSRILNEAFLRNPYESEEGARDLAVRTGLTVKQIQTWYSRKRFNTKKRKRSASPVAAGTPSSSPVSSPNIQQTDFKSYHMLTPAQTTILNSYYDRSPYVDDSVALQISTEIGVTVEKIKTWFKSKRKMMSKKKKRGDAPASSLSGVNGSGLRDEGDGKPSVSAKEAADEKWSDDEEEEEEENKSSEGGGAGPVDLALQEEQVLAGLFGIDVDAVKQLREQYSTNTSPLVMRLNH
ncbi:hypothetical protein BDR26DRAFT_1003814 [Obelidium mucronatum]|nr:hypothetical protein BDR26DRAFT_1003814 [Obelidium mucronatum]